MKPTSLNARLRQADAKRPDFPGEHLLVLGAGAVLLLMAGRSRSLVGRTLAGMAGSALVGRAASGTGGLARVVGALAGRRRW